MSNPKNNPIPTLNLRRQSIPREFDLLALASTFERKPSNLKDYNDLNEIDTDNVSSFINYITTNKQVEGLPPIEIEI